MIESMEYSDNVPSRPLSSAAMGGSAIIPNGNGNGSGPPARVDTAGSPSHEANTDPTPTRHAPAIEKSKYEAAVPYKSRKGDRFS